MKLKEFIEDLEKGMFIKILSIDYADGTCELFSAVYHTEDEQDMIFLNSLAEHEIVYSHHKDSNIYKLELEQPHIQPTYDDPKPLFEDIEIKGEIPAYEVITQTDLINQPNHYNLGQIETREYILDVLHHNKHLEPIDAYYLGNILKYLSVRLGNKDDKLQDMKKAKNYLDKWIGEYENE